MYLVVGDHKSRSLMMVLWSWASGNKRYRDMRRYLVEKLGPGTYLYRDDERVRKVLVAIQWKYGKDDSGKYRLRVFRVEESEVDLGVEIKPVAPLDVSVPSSSKPQTVLPQLSESETSRLLHKQQVFLSEIGYDTRREVYRRILKLEDPIKGVAKVSEELKLKHGVALVLLEHILSPGVRGELREMGFSDEEIPHWVPA